MHRCSPIRSSFSKPVLQNEFSWHQIIKDIDMKITLKEKIVHRIKIILFYLWYRAAYRNLGFKALISHPLGIQGKRYISLAKGVTIRDRAWLIALKIDEHDPSLDIGEGSSLGFDNHIAAVRKVELGRFVLTANGVYISDNQHAFEDITVPIMHQPVVFRSAVSIGDGTWIGEHACIIGARIGKNCVIGANAVVTKDIPDYSVVAGAPSRIIKRYNIQSNAWEKVSS
jgi:acetyltransferase-like isoleucine patch superfamily enzyme